MMKTKTLKFQRLILAAFFVFAIALGVAFMPKSQIAIAEETTYTESSLDYFDESKGVTTKYYLDKASNQNTSWPGIRVEMSVKEGVYDATLTYRGAVNPVNRSVIAFDAVYDTDGTTKKVLADAAIMTYTSVKDPSKQFSIIAFNRNREGICWYVMALTGVENLEYRNGYVYYVGTDQRAIGRRDNSDSFGYDTNGYTNWSARSNGWGQLFGAGVTMHVDETTGHIYYNDYVSCGAIASQAFIDATKPGLKGTDYEAACSVEYVQAMLTEMKTYGAFFSMTYLGLQEREIGFNFITFYGQDVGSGGKELNVSPYTKNVNTTIYLEEVPELHMSDIFPRETIQSVYSTEPYVCGFFGTDTWSGNDNWWDSRTSTGQDDVLSMYIKDVGQYTLISQAYTGAGNAGFHQVYTLNVVYGTPTIAAVDGAVFFKGETHDLRSYFDVWHLGEESETLYGYTIDGESVGGEYVSDGRSHEIGLTLTDKYGNSEFYEYEVSAFEIVIPASVTATGYYNQPVMLPVPKLPTGTQYTLSVYNEADEFLTDLAAYVFEKDGNYTIGYKMVSPFVVGGKVEKECAYALSLDFEPSVITLDGEYEDSYFEGKELGLISASASNSVSDDLTVSVKAYNGETEQTVTDGTVKLIVGKWTIVYAAEGAERECAFVVVKDEQEPEIVVEGTYDSEYEKGLTLTVHEAFVSDNSGEEIVYTVSVYCDGDEVTVTNKEFVLSKGGNYKIVYKATDNAGNATENTFEFTVPSEGFFNELFGCNGSVVSYTGLTSIVMIAFVGVIVIRRKKNENE